METIRVTNKGEKLVKGRFDGKDYAFVPGEPTFLTYDAAGHIFGLGEEDKAPALNRLGFLIPGREACTMEAALKRLDEFQFDQGRVTFDPEDDDLKDQGGPQAARKTGGRRPHAGDSGGASAGGKPPAGDSGE